MPVLDLKNVNPEIRAFIYQQIADLEPHLPEGSAISFILNEDSPKAVAGIQVETPFGNIEAQGEPGTIFESLTSAKELLIKQIGEITREMDEGEASAADYDDAIEAVMNKEYLH